MFLSMLPGGVVVVVYHSLSLSLTLTLVVKALFHGVRLYERLMKDIV
jgi:hypothetical protein